MATIIGTESLTTSPKFFVQIGVPFRYYGSCEYFMPREMADWWSALGFNYSYVGRESWGSGFDSEGNSTMSSTYMVYGIDEADALAFKIQFPHVKTHVSEQFDWKKLYAEEAALKARKAELLKRRRDRYASKKNILGAGYGRRNH